MYLTCWDPNQSVNASCYKSIFVRTKAGHLLIKAYKPLFANGVLLRGDGFIGYSLATHKQYVVVKARVLFNAKGALMI
jgi:hypothetical protein